MRKITILLARAGEHFQAATLRLSETNRILDGLTAIASTIASCVAIPLSLPSTALLLSLCTFNSIPLFGIDNHALVAAASKANEAQRFNIKEYGAIGDGVAMDTEAVQKTIDACHEAGGGVVWVPAGDFQIGTIILKSNVTLSLDYGANLLGSTNATDYPTDKLSRPREGDAYCLIYAENAQNITIEGLGVIDGRGTHENFPRNRRGGRNSGIRPRLMRLESCENLTFSGVTYKRPAFWGLHLIDCKNVHFNAVTVRFRNNNYNNDDGFDIDGCENVLIENCDISTGDDAICLKSSLNPCRNIVVRACRADSNTAAVKFGSSSRGGFIDISITNCYFHDCPMGAIKLQSVDGGRLENINISRIVMKDVGNPLFMRLGNRGSTFGKGRADVSVGTLKNIRISDVVANVIVEDRAKSIEAVYKNTKVDSTPGVTDDEKAKAGPIMITGIPGHDIENVVLENIKISYPGHGNQNDARGDSQWKPTLRSREHDQPGKGVWCAECAA